MRHLYGTRAEVLRLNLEMTNGKPSQSWQKVEVIIDPYLNVPGELMCRIDLAFQRPGKDLPMPVVAGRVPDRVGLMFYDVTDEILAGDRIRCLSGPVSGTFEMRVRADPALGYGVQAHHLEVQVVEVAQNSPVNFINGPEG